MEWIYIQNELPPRDKEVWVIRGWEGSNRSLYKAIRKSSEPLTIDKDFTRNCWWVDEEAGSRFCDGTVVAWLKVPDFVVPEFDGMNYERYIPSE